MASVAFVPKLGRGHSRVGTFSGKKEGWSRFDSFYFVTAVTATTAGYGDFRPVHRVSRVIAIAIAVLELTMTGILIAVAVHATACAPGQALGLLHE